MTSTSNLSFKPTYLYIKQHSVTGKLYFGKTTLADVEHYKGSGIHWLKHIKKHGTQHVVTLWYCLFYDQEECIKFATLFSIQQNIVESNEWLNLVPENCIGGSKKGHGSGNTKTEEHKAKIAASNRGKVHNISPENREKLRLIATQRKDSIERRKQKSKYMLSDKNPMANPVHRQTVSKALTGKKQSPQHAENNALVKLQQRIKNAAINSTDELKDIIRDLKKTMNITQISEHLNLNWITVKKYS